MADVTQGISGISDIATQLKSGANGSISPALDVGSLLGSMSMTSIVIGLVAGLVGSGYFMYGKKNSNVAMLCSGAALCVVPYFISNTILLIVACIATAAAPFVI